MPKIIFKYKGNNTIIECEYTEKMREILKKFTIKEQIDITKIYFLYNTENINEAIKKNEDIKIKQIINKHDKENNEMNVLVNELDKQSQKIDKHIIKSKEIICPECKECINIKIDNYNLI